VKTPLETLRDSKQPPTVTTENWPNLQAVSGWYDGSGLGIGTFQILQIEFDIGVWIQR
jgi:hypothetical protein